MENAYVRIKGSRNLERKIRRILQSLPSNELFGQIGAYAQTIIKQRTLEGKDYKKKFFKGYTKRYKEVRKEAGRPTNKVDLFFSGSMLSSMDWTAEKNQVRLYFLNTTDENGVKNPLKAFFLNEKRTFFKLSEKERKDIVEIVEDYYRGIIS